jgi:hypothetical protein
MLAPDGNCTEQFKKCNDMARAYLNRIRCSKLTTKMKWTAITSIMEPSVLYPFMACSYTDKEMETLDKTLSKAKYRVRSQ